MSLSTLPFLALIVALGVLAVGFAIAAWPGRESPRPRPPEREFGTAPPGWLERAEKEFEPPSAAERMRSNREAARRDGENRPTID